MRSGGVDRRGQVDVTGPAAWRCRWRGGLLHAQRRGQRQAAWITAHVAMMLAAVVNPP